MRPIPAPARVIRTALSLRAAGFVRPPREGRILAGSQRVPCPPRHPARRPPPGFARPPRERRILEVSQRVPARRVALRAAGSARRRFLPAASPARASASTVQSYPCLPPVLCAASPCARRFFPAPRGKGGYWQGASACRARRVALRARPRPPRGLTLRAAGSARLQFLPALRGKGGYWQGASACPVRRPPRRPAPARPRPLRARRIHCAVLSLPAAGFFLRSAARVPRVAYPCARPASPVRPIPARRGFCPPPVLPALRGKGGYWKRASACRARRVTLRARPRHPHSPIPPCRGFCPPRRPARAGYCLCPAGRADIGIEPARACAPRRPARASASTVQSYPCLPPVFSFAPPPASARAAYPCLPPVFSCAPREGRILAGSQRVPCPPRHPARPPASSARPNPTRRGFCPPRRPARASASTVQSYPCLPPVFSCAPPPAFPMRPIPARRGFCPPRRPARAGYCLCPAGRADIGRDTAPAARVSRTVLSLRAAGFVRPPREGRILEVSQRVPCPPRHPARPPAAGFCPSAAGRADIGREPARAVPAASPCAPARVPHAAYPCLTPVLCAASSCAPPPASPVRPIPARRGFCPPASRALRRPRSPCGLSLRPPRLLCGLSLRARVLPAASFCLRSAGRADIGREPAHACAPRRPAPPARVPVRPIPACRGFCPPRRPCAPARVPHAAYPCLTPVLCAASSCAPPPASPVRPIPARRGFCPSAAGRADIGSEPARTVPAASPCAPARVLRAA